MRARQLATATLSPFFFAYGSLPAVNCFCSSFNGRPGRCCRSPRRRRSSPGWRTRHPPGSPPEPRHQRFVDLFQHRHQLLLIGSLAGHFDSDDDSRFGRRGKLDVVARPISAVGELHHPRFRVGRRCPVPRFGFAAAFASGIAPTHCVCNSSQLRMASARRMGPFAGSPLTGHTVLPLAELVGRFVGQSSQPLSSCSRTSSKQYLKGGSPTERRFARMSPHAHSILGDAVHPSPPRWPPATNRQSASTARSNLLRAIGSRPACDSSPSRRRTTICKPDAPCTNGPVPERSPRRARWRKPTKRPATIADRWRSRPTERVVRL